MATVNEFNDWAKTFEEPIVTFGKGEDDWVDAKRFNPKENGLYETIRLGLTGRYKHLNEYDILSGWQIHALDGSRIVAYRNRKVEIPERFK